MELLWEIAGGTGAAAILSAYLAVSMGWLKTGRTFQIANLLGACAFVLNGAVHQAWPSAAANAAWFLISAIALLRMRPARAVPVVPASILPHPSRTPVARPHDSPAPALAENSFMTHDNLPPVYFLSDSTGITAETLGNTLLTQFPANYFDRITPAQAPQALRFEVFRA